MPEDLRKPYRALYCGAPRQGYVWFSSYVYSLGLICTPPHSECFISFLGELHNAQTDEQVAEKVSSLETQILTGKAKGARGTPQRTQKPKSVRIWPRGGLALSSLESSLRTRKAESFMILSAGETKPQ